MCMTMITIPSLSHKRRRAFEKKAGYDQDYRPFPFPGRGRKLSRGRLCMTMTTIPSIFQKRRDFDVYDHDPLSSISQKRRIAFERKAVYDHDHHHFPSPEEEESFSEEGCV